MEETVEEVPEITHKVFLDIDIDEQRIGTDSHLTSLIKSQGW